MILAMMAPRSVMSISSPCLTLARTLDVSWFSMRTDTSLMTRV